jgi:hypothetical protein
MFNYVALCLIVLFYILNVLLCLIVLFYVLILLFYVLFVSIVLFYVFICVQICTVLPPLGINPIAVNKHFKYLPPGQHVGQPWAKISIIRLSMAQLNTIAGRRC